MTTIKISNDTHAVNTAMKISDDIRLSIKEKLSKVFTGGDDNYVFFRKIFKLNTFGNDPRIKLFRTPVEYRRIYMADYERLDPKEKERVVIQYKLFSAQTNKRGLRPENKVIENKDIFLTQHNYADLDITDNYTFDFTNTKFAPYTPRPSINKNEGDIVFGYVSKKTYSAWEKENKNNSRYQLRADKWLIVTPQFLRAWSIVTSSDDCDSIKRLVPEKYHDTPEFETQLRKNLFRTNRLMTNTLLKRKLLHMATYNNSILPNDEFEQVFKFMNTEHVSIKYVDTWACLILIVKYGEIPCNENKMVHLEKNYKGKQRSNWNIPSDFVRMLFVRFANNIKNEDIENYKYWCEYYNLDSDKTFFENAKYFN